MSDPVGIAVVGAGGIADAHLFSYQRLGERVRRVAVVDVDESRARRAVERFDFGDALTDLAGVLARNDVDAVSICTPPFLHVEQAVAALEAGKHVLCEKPVALTLAGLDAIAKAAEESGKIFSGVFQLRFGRGAQQLRALVDEGKFGRLHLGMAETMWFRDQNYYAVPWRGKWDTEGGGATVSQAVHVIDALCWLMGEPVRVYAEAGVFRVPIEVDDSSVATVRFRSGAIATITSTTSALSEQRTLLEIHGTDLSAISQGPVYDCTIEPFLLSSAADPDYAAGLQREMEERVPKGYKLLHRGPITEFVNAIEQGEQPSVGIDDCRRALQVTTAIYKSAMTQQPVDLPIAPDDPFYSALPPHGYAFPA